VNGNRKTPTPFSVAVFGCLGAALVIAPCVFLFSSKSPLRSSDAAYINGFVMGVGFIFYLLLGIAFLTGAAFSFKSRTAARRPTQ
jgi:hypothetical protein